MLGITVLIESMLSVAAVKWYRHVLQREGNILKKVLNFEVTERRKGGRPKATWKKHVEALIKDIEKTPLTKKNGGYVLKQ